MTSPILRTKSLMILHYPCLAFGPFNFISALTLRVSYSVVGVLYGSRTAKKIKRSHSVRNGARVHKAHENVFSRCLRDIHPQGAIEGEYEEVEDCGLTLKDGVCCRQFSVSASSVGGETASFLSEEGRQSTDPTDQVRERVGGIWILGDRQPGAVPQGKAKKISLSTDRTHHSEAQNMCQRIGGQLSRASNTTADGARQELIAAGLIRRMWNNDPQAIVFTSRSVTDGKVLRGASPSMAPGASLFHG